MQLTIGFSPCPNDTFMMDALVHQRVEDRNIRWEMRITDIETLNNWALQELLDVTKMSISAWLHVQDTYTLLESGAALGFGCGPLVIAKHPLTDDELARGPVAIPGTLTTANLLFSLRYPHITNKVPLLFSEIEETILRGDVIAGVIIHESRFTYEGKGLAKILDLGEDWEQTTGRPLPLGIFAAKTSLGPGLHRQVSETIRQSVQFAFNNRQTVMPFVREHAREMEDRVMNAHINTYVNDFSVNLGFQGLEAIGLLRSRALLSGLV